MIKLKKLKKSNQGNSFIVVVATISFLAVLVTALLVAVAVCYRLKAYDINSRDNFYYLDQAMDEIYEGVGSIAMKKLNEAYDDTAEVLVYFDPVKESYVTMDNDNANALMQASYLRLLKTEASDAAGAFSSGNIYTTITGFLSRPYNATSATDGVQVSVGNVTWDETAGSLTINNLILKREAKYSTVNASKKISNGGAGAESFVQSITTDLVISKPEFKLNFSSIGNDISELYDFVLISDMGVEIKGVGTLSNIYGNVYAAADFYNKEYTDTDTKNAITSKVQAYSADAEQQEEYAKNFPLSQAVCSYFDGSTEGDAKLEACNGVLEKSMYSGFIVDGAKVTMISDKIIVPGSLAAMNCGMVDIVGTLGTSGVQNTELWADSVILGGYAKRVAGTKNKYMGSTMNMKADAYVYDDLEVNANGSKYALAGSYYGYNFATTDNRKYTDDFIAASTNRNRRFLEKVKINDGSFKKADDSLGHLIGQAHYNSSSIVVNGEDATLDLTNTKEMYVAGQAYVELSKATTKATYVAGESGLTKVDDDKVDEVADDDKIDVSTYHYYNNDDVNADADKASYSYEEQADGSRDKTRVQDYRTGEAVSIKSNQLAYIPPYNIKVDDEGNYYVMWPELLQKDEDEDEDPNDPYNDIRKVWDELEKVPVIQTIVNGKEYYFYDFSKSDTVTMNEYMAMYAKLFEKTPDQARSAGDLVDFYDITDYQAFKINDLKLVIDESKADHTEIYTNSAISVKNGGNVSIVANQKEINALLTASEVIDAANRPAENASGVYSDDEKLSYASSFTSGMQKQYKEMKQYLTTKITPEAKEFAYEVPEHAITPINYYFDFSGLDGIKNGASAGSNNLTTTNVMKSGYVVFLGEDDVTVTADLDGKVKGIVLCKGDVTFASNVTEFEGLIVAGGKIIADHSINFVANAEVIKSVLRECDQSRTFAGSLDKSAICKLFRHFESNYDDVTPSTETQDYVSMKSVSAVMYEDILTFENWKKNVD